MNKLLLSAVVLCGVALTAQGQTFVPKIGLSYNYNTESVENFNAKPKPGYLLGFGYNMRMSDHMAFQPELYLVRKSWDFNTSIVQTMPNSPDITTGNYHDKYRVSYLEIPVLLKYKFAHEKMFVTLGPYVSIGLSGQHEFDYITEYSGLPTVTKKGKDDILFAKATKSSNNNNNIINHRVDFGFQPGFGYVLPRKVLLELRYDLGLVKTFSGRHSQNQTLMLTLSYPLLRKVSEE